MKTNGIKPIGDRNGWIFNVGKDYPHSSVTHWFHGLVHRKEGPAIIFSNGTKMWYKNGEYLAYSNGFVRPLRIV